MPPVRDLLGVRQTSGDGFTGAAAAIRATTDIEGCFASQAGDVSRARSGRKVTGLRRSRSQAIVPKVGQRRKTKSSMPMTLSSSHRATPYDPQEGVVAHGHHQALGKGCFRPAAKHQTELVHDHPKPLSTLAAPGQNTSIELLAKDAPPANNDVTPKRRASIMRITRRPLCGRSDGRRTHRLCTRRPGLPQWGQVLTGQRDRSRMWKCSPTL